MKGLVSLPSASPQPLLFFSHRRHDSHIIIPTSQSHISVLKTQQHQHQHRHNPFICLSSSSSVVEQQEDSLPLRSPPSAIDSVDARDDPDALPISASQVDNQFLLDVLFLGIPYWACSKFTSNHSGCKGCGREQVERGCNGEGRIQGGIATIPGFGWWPIKAYRPCPGFVASGGSYRRRGQRRKEKTGGETRSNKS
ncbi:hypothetical protein Cgig2_031482 [Carnegiea gigantea]|uniref:Uncharacterized protein n=1 Tax=Carnegiea gigantea TaxID=171969 RepID=A0A9Q1K3G3_9CARY|nr:hypothetical protein Cgig2_031482 [Carnegiea gigantea]